jgi:hypothetical protein
VSAGELVQPAAAARAGGSRWDGIAAACGIRDYRDITGIAALPCSEGPAGPVRRADGGQVGARGPADSG